MASSGLLILVSKVLSRYLDHAQREQAALGISDADDMVSSGPHLSEDLLLNRETPVREYTRGRNFLLKIFGNRTGFRSVAIQDSGLTSSEVCALPTAVVGPVERPAGRGRLSRCRCYASGSRGRRAPGVRDSGGERGWRHNPSGQGRDGSRRNGGPACEASIAATDAFQLAHRAAALATGQGLIRPARNIGRAPPQSCRP